MLLPIWPMNKTRWQYQPPVVGLSKDPTPPIPLEASGSVVVVVAGFYGQFSPGQSMQFVADLSALNVPG
jgi:hypothetical protein